ncbi:hypothetical protein [Mycobacterium sp.]|uniref:phage tail tube protein n=1 Tax=Mycobacterium sp. TaxID=1785 RepID=UPI0026135797|nr:hypothetical protein [Mycobacterium sp.]
MSITATNLILGPGTLYTGAFGATEPADTAVNTTPEVSAWTDLGATDGGVKLTIDQKFTELTVDQVVDSLGRRLTAREIMVDTNLAEPTLANLQLAMNGGTAATGAGFSSLDPLNVTSATQPTYVAVILDGFAPAGFRRRVVIRKALNTSSIQSAYAKDKETYIPVTFAGHYVSSSITPFHITDQTS